MTTQHDHWLPLRWIKGRDLTKVQTKTDEYSNGVRVFRSAPGTVTLQLRNYGALDYREKNKPRRLIISADLGKNDVECVIAALQLARDKFTMDS